MGGAQVQTPSFRQLSVKRHPHGHWLGKAREEDEAKISK